MIKPRALIYVFIAIVLAVPIGFTDNIQPVSAAGTAYYVAMDGNDSWSGTLPTPNGGNTDGPFRTIQRCATVATAGSTCNIRAGIYRETVTPANNGTSTDPITFQPYNNEDVTISGNDVVTGWTAHDLTGGKAIYKANMPWTMNVRSTAGGILQNSNNQIFVNSAMMPEAQFPNIAPDALTHQTNAMHLRATAVSNITQYTATYTAPALGSFATNFFQGAKINFTAGSTIAWATCDVTSSSGSSANFQCNADPGAWNARSDLTGTWTTPGIGNYLYFWGKYTMLDAPGEWFRDNSNSTLYLWTTTGANPSTMNIEARRRAWGLDVRGRSYINVKGIRFFAAAINSSSTSHHITIDEIEGLYMWHVQEIPPFYYDVGTQAIRFLGSDMTLSNSLIAYTAGPLIRMGGDTTQPRTSNLRLTNNVAYDTGYMGLAATVRGGIIGNNGNGPQFHLVQNNTMWNSGHLLIEIGSGITIYNNDVYQSHLQISDLATIYNWNTDGLGNEVAYNYVHDNYAELETNLLKYGGHGIYLDDNSDNTAIHHNITWSTTSPGIFMFGKDAPGPGHRKVYNNTVDGTLSAAAKTSGGFNQTLVGTEYRNNIATKGGLTDANLTLSNNLIGEGSWVNRSGRDYALRNDSIAVDQGMVLPPYTNGYAGANPDQGALEYGRVPFVAGAVIRQRDLAGLVVTCEPDVAGTAATCRVTGLPMGRKLPNEFQIKIGEATPTQYCQTPMNYVTNYGIGICKNVPTGGQTGLQPISVNLGNGWLLLEGSRVDLGGLAVFSVFPPGGPIAGGTPITLTGRRFAYINDGNSYRTPITISNPVGGNLASYQILVKFNSASLIAASKMRSDCGDIRFVDAYGTLSYWLEDGCNSTETRVWVKVLAIPAAGATISMTYGNPSLTSASNGKDTFVYFPDLNAATVDPAIALDTTAGATIAQTGGAIRVNGTTNSGNQYGQWGFRIETWKLSMPPGYALDSNLTVVSGSASFKGSMGIGDINFYGGLPGKKIGFWNGAWNQLGTSNVTTATFTNKKLSMGATKNATDYTVRWFEDGNTTPLASRNVTEPSEGAYNYGPDTIATFDARFSNVRIRYFVYPEPTTAVGAETGQAVRFALDGLPCQSVIAISYTQATCVTPPHAAGNVNITATNPDSASFSFASFKYVAKPDTIGLFKPSTGEWYLRNSNSTGAPDITLSFGGSVNHLPIAGDWNGDGVDTVGIYDTSNGLFQLRDSNTTGAAQYIFTLGNPGDTPLAGRWDNTMTHDGAGVYRNSNGILYLRRELTTGFSDYYMVLGNPGDAGIAGDWDGNGYDTVGVYRASQNRFYLSNVNGNGITYADIAFDYGDVTAKPIAGDWTQNAYHRVGYFRDGQVWLRNTLSTGVSDTLFGFGFTGALPVTGKWVGASSPPNLSNVLVTGGSSNGHTNTEMGNGD